MNVRRPMGLKLFGEMCLPLSVVSVVCVCHLRAHTHLMYIKIYVTSLCSSTEPNADTPLPPSSEMSTDGVKCVRSIE